MQMLYNSDSFVVVQFEVPGRGEPSDEAPVRGGFEIVDKAAGKEIFIEGALADRFRQGVEALVEQGASTEEALDGYIAGFASFAQQPVILH